MTYTYRGKKTVAAEEAEALAQHTTTKGQPRQRRRVAECGTESGYRKHIREHDIACDDCLRAHAADMAVRRGKQSNWKRRGKPQCGTYSAAIAHRKKGEQVCGPCREAENAYHREYQKNRRAAA